MNLFVNKKQPDFQYLQYIDLIHEIFSSQVFLSTIF